MSTADIRQSAQNGKVPARVMASSQIPGSVYALASSPSNRHQCEGGGCHGVTSPGLRRAYCSFPRCHGFAATGPTDLFVGVCHT